MKQWKRFTGIFLIIAMLLVESVTIVSAADIGGESTVTKIKYQVVRDENYNITQALVEFTGVNLLNKVVLFSTNEGTKAMGNKVLQYENFIQYSFTAEEVRSFTGEVRIGTGSFDLGIGNFPTIDSTTKIINTSNNDNLIINGRNLDQIGDSGDYTIRGEYGKAGQFKTFPAGSATKIEINAATPPGDRGLQNIRIVKEKKSGVSLDPEIIVEYNYNNVFSFISDIPIDNDIEMYPNTGARGDQFYLRSSEFTKAYDVYLFKSLDGTEGFSSKNKAVFKGFIPVSSTNKQALLTMEVPQGVELGSHYVVLAETINGQVVAQKIIEKSDEPVKYTVVDATTRARIDNVYPGRGPDIGGTPVGIEGRNLLTSSINPSDLIIDYGNKTIELSGDKQIVTVDYASATYQGVPATVKRSIKVQIGNKATFQETAPNIPRVEIGANDKLYVITPKVDDANISPNKEVLLEITTIVKEDTSGKEYVFQERAVWNKHFVFEPSSLIPTVDSVTPSKVQLVDGGLKDDTLLSIKGKNFLVNRYIDGNGETIVNYPSILVKTANDVDTNNYEIIIKKQNDKAVAYFRALDGQLKEIEGAEIVVLDDSDRLIDGTVGREVGTRILVRIPKDVAASIGTKNLQITNPTRESNEFGQSGIKIDAIEFVETNDSPEIDEVVPNIVPVEGGQEIQVKGSNFLEGVKVFIDGKEVTGVSREIAPGGNKFILKFKAPKGREGVTQLLVMNPSGGMAMAEFIYVETLQKDPKIISFSPNKGGNGTLVYIKGDNFLKPDPTTRDTSGIGIYRLIGTRVLLDGRDVNEYYTEGNNITLQNYTSKVGNLLNVVDGTVKLADYYNSVILKDADNKYYTFDIDTADRIILTDGVQSTYRLTEYRDGAFNAIKNGAEYKIEIKPGTDTEPDSLVITRGAEEIILNVMTPYKVENGEITGNRVKVISRSEITFVVPQLGTEKWYDLSVQNPDTKIDTRTGQNGFYYFKQPKKNPTITDVNPPQGSSDGGYTVIINGSDFEDNGIDKSRVFVGGVEVPKTDLVVGTDKNTITITKMPAYPGDLKLEVENGRKTVPIVIVNSDGGNAYLMDGFTYVIPTSNPKINRIAPNQGNAAGGEIVRIFGSDFRFFEPYEDANGNAKYDKGEKFVNINGDKDQDGNDLWTNLEGKNVEDLTDDDKKILPRVYFGKGQGEIIEFADGYLVVKVPKGTKGAVDVFVVNNDFGVSNKVKFTYLASNPKIDNIIPPQGKKQGMDKIEINGSGFANSKIEIYKEGTKDGVTQNVYSVEMPLVHFGDIGDITIVNGIKVANISNRQIPVSDISGLGGGIINGKAKVTIGNINVNYDATSGSRKVTLSITEDDKTFRFVINGYDDSVKYVDIRSLKDSEGNSYTNGYELIRLEVDSSERKLIVERGYAPYHEKMIANDRQISLYTPSHYAIGTVPVTVINPDGGTATGKFEYKNPDSKPRITNLTKEGDLPTKETINGKEVLVLRMTYKGGNTVSVIGEDFREGAEIFISDIAHITKDSKNDLVYNLPNRLTFVMPNVGEDAVGKLHKVVVSNEDGASASSDENNPPIYILFVKGETAPAIEKITPDMGPAAGGTTIKIEGKDFREKIEGFSGKLTVYFGDKKVPDSNVRFIDTRTISVIVPPGIPGTVEVKVENPDGELSNPNGTYTYLSNPKITAVVDPLDPSERAPISVISVLGGQEIKLKGAGFMEGAKVYFAPKITPAKESELGNANIIYIDGKPYILEEGTEGTEYKWINSETVTIKTPQGKTDSFGVIVVNPDKGASPIYTNLTYGLPEIAAPSGVVAELVYDRFIRVHWNAVTGATEYEIFVVIDDKNTELIGSTELTSFAYNDLEPRTRYRFIVKAVGDFGSSKPSMESNTVRTGSKVGPPDEDGSLAENTTMSKTGNTANVVIGTKDRSRGTIVIDLTRGALAGSKELVVSIPASVVVDSDNRNIQVIGKDFSLQFQTAVFNVANLRENRKKSDAGVRFVIAEDSGNTQVSSGNQLSTVYNLEASTYIGQTTLPIDYLASAMSFTLDYDEQKASLRKLTELDFNYFDPVKNAWKPLGTSSKNWVGSASSGVIRLGKYAIIGSRR